MRRSRIFKALIAFASAVVPKCCWANSLGSSSSLRGGKSEVTETSKSSSRDRKFAATLDITDIHSKSDLMLRYGDWVDFEINYGEAPEADTRLVVSTVCQQGVDVTFSATEEVEYDESGAKYALHLVDNELNGAQRSWKSMETTVCQVRLLSLYDHFLDVDGVDAFKTHVLDNSLLIVQGESSDLSDLE